MLNEYEERLEDEIDAQGGTTGEVTSLLNMAQRIWDYIPEEVHCYIADRCDSTVTQVQSIIKFNSCYSSEPLGRRQVRVCVGRACSARRSGEILNKLESCLGIGVGETTPDKEVTLGVGRCFGYCAEGPTVKIDHGVLRNATEEEVLREIGK